MAQRWTRDHERRRERILEMLARDVQPWPDMSPEATAARRALPLLDWSRAYLPHYFDRPFARFHALMADAAGEPGMPTFVGAFRGAGKSALLALARPLQRILARQAPYTIYGSQVQRLAAQTMDCLRLEVEHNPRLRADYGDLTCEGEEAEWTVDLGRLRGEDGQWKLRVAKLEAFGIGMSPRGRRHRQYRPSEFIGDDLETAELARNPRREQQLWDWMFDEVLPALEPEQFVFTVLGTMHGPGCMLERAREMTARADRSGRPLAKLFMQPATVEGRSVWPERFSDEGLARVRATVGLRNWLRNYDLVAEDPDKPFQPGWLLDYAPGEVDVGALDVVAFLDPALSEAPTGCPRALVVVGADRKSGVRYVLDAWVERGTPSQMVEQVFGAHEHWKPRLIGIEINGGYALLRPLLEQRMATRGWLPIRYVTQDEAKATRIERLAPAMEAGRWRFPRNPGPGVRRLQEQLLAYPDGFVDGPDALASCNAMLPDAFRPGPRGPEYKSLGKRRNMEAVV